MNGWRTIQRGVRHRGDDLGSVEKRIYRYCGLFHPMQCLSVSITAIIDLGECALVGGLRDGGLGKST